MLEWAEGDQWTGEESQSPSLLTFDITRSLLLSAQCEINETGPIEFKYAEIYSPDELESEFQWSGPDGSNIVLDLPSEGSVEIVSSWEGETLSEEHLAPVSASVPPPEAEAELPTPITKAAVPVVEDTKGEAVVALEEVKEAPIPVKNTITPAPAPAPAAVRPPPAASPISTAVKEQAVVNIVEAPAAVKSKKGRATKLNATKAKA